ncbi:hypothetical protein BDR03DRAFT_428205 [Suillus americanus]|nr:hypothetical protein BDR03DRAFT_428205 [Suillus americanus]
MHCPSSKIMYTWRWPFIRQTSHRKGFECHGAHCSSIFRLLSLSIEMRSFSSHCNILSDSEFSQLFLIVALACYLPKDTTDDGQLVYLLCILVHNISACGTRLPLAKLGLYLVSRCVPIEKTLSAGFEPEKQFC